MGQVGHGPPKILVGWATMHLAPPIIGLYVWMFFSEVGRRHSILKEELGKLMVIKISIELCANRLFTEFYTHHTRFLFVPIPLL